MFRKLCQLLRQRAPRRQPVVQRKPTFEQLELRLAPAGVNVLTFHDDIASTGQNLAEIQLTPANVKVGSFGKIFTTPVDGQVYAQPLVDTGVTITTGPNTKAGAAGLHDVVFVATEHDSLYAVDASSSGGAILWQRTFLDTTNPSNNTLGASSITTVPNGDTGSADINPEIGITSTPVIDSTTNIIYVEVETKEAIGGNSYYVQRLHAINIANGTDAVAPFMIGKSDSNNNNTTPIYVYGTGSGSVTDPYNGTGKKVVQFNALREAQRSALTLVNNTIYVAWASHGDNGPYHGLVVTWNVANITTTGFQLSGVLNATPNAGLGGIWQGGGRPVFEPDGSAFYFATGNGGFDTTLNSNGMPINGDYGDSVVKAEPDSTTSPTHQNINGWGMKIVDYFTPYNQAALNSADEDFGSGAPLLLPPSAGVAGHSNLLLIGGKDGKIYVIDRNLMGHYDPNNDHVVNAVPNGSGNYTAPVAVSGLLSTPAYYNGVIYVIAGYSGVAHTLVINANGTLTSTSQTAATFGYLPGSPSISANGTTGGIVWLMDRNTNEIHAYNANSFGTELWNSSQKAGGADNVGAVVKFAVPTVANGEVYVGTTDALVVYGLTPPAGTAPSAPTNLTATALSGTSVNLTWQDPTTAPNTASGYYIEESTDDKTFKQVTTAPAGSKALAVGGLQTLTPYYFRIRGFNGVGPSAYSNVANTTTTNQVPSLNFSTGFAGSQTALTYNGVAKINGTAAQLTDGGGGEASSIFSISPVDVSKFTTQFTFQSTAGATTSSGITFCIQAVGPTALGQPQGGLGYGAEFAAQTGGIPHSIAVKFDLGNSEGEGLDSTGLFTNGAAPTNIGSIDLTPTGINLHSGDIFQVNMTYNGTTLTVTIEDTATKVSATQTYTVNIPAVMGTNIAYVGFTGSTGTSTSTQSILTWTLSPNATTAPATPTGLGAEPASATSVTVTWTNTATNQTGFHLDRATDSGFTQNLITQTLPAAPFSFTDTLTGLAPGSTFYYRLRAFNSAGDSANSNMTSVFIPLAPARPTNAIVELVSATEIDLTWTDNAGTTAQGYHILRQANSTGGFTLVASLPPLAAGVDGNASPPAPYPTWADTNLTPGTYYEYHIQAFNISGNNDFIGTNATTLTLPPTGLTAKAASGAVNLAWTAPVNFGGVTYNLYRGTTPGGEGTTPLVTGITNTSFTDAAVTSGQAYYYTVTAVNANAARVPVLPAESAFSNEASPTTMTTPALNFSGGFAGSASSLTFNGPAIIKGSNAQLTDGGGNEASSFFSSSPVSVANFTTQFTFQTTAGAGTGAGFTFCIQGVGPKALGLDRMGLGYGAQTAGGTGGIANSVAVKFDLANNTGEGPDTTGIYTDGAAPVTVGNIDLTPSGVNMHNGDVFQVNMTYNGTTLSVTITDTATSATATQNYTINIPATVAASTAYVGFTAATGGRVATQSILTWTYSPTQAASPPAAPTNLQAAAGNGQVALTWTASAGATTYNIYRGTTSGTEVSVKTGVLTASYTDSGLTNGQVYYYEVTAVNAGGESKKSNEAFATPQVPTSGGALNFSGGFAGSTSSLTFNGSAAIKGANAQLTNGGGYEASSLFSSSPVSVANFTTQFTFQTTAGASTGAGFTFCIQDVGPTALGLDRMGLGYGAQTAGGTGGIAKSVAVKFDLANNTGEGPDTTGIYTNGQAPVTVGNIDLTPSGVNMHNGDVFQVNMTYNGTTLSVTITDTVTNATDTQNYTINIPGTVGSSTAYVGFTGATGGRVATQSILTWTFSPTSPTPSPSSSAPAAPTNLQVTPGNGQAAPTGLTAKVVNGAVNLSWAAVPNAVSYNIFRSTTPGGEGSTPYATNVTGTSFTDTKVAPGTTYYYTITAVTSSGQGITLAVIESAFSSEVSAVVPAILSAKGPKI